jgi:threonine synthase
MRYISTRGGMNPQAFSDILLAGLAPDGGLTMAETYPKISNMELTEFSQLSYADLAYEIISRFVDDVPAQELKNIIEKTYTAEVYCNGRDASRSAEITPLLKLEENLYLQELSNGPTLAFKDMAMQLLGNLFEYVLEQKNQQVNIVGATSGDTGSAAEYAMRGKKGINVFMLSPKGKMSPFQRSQMFSLHDENIFNITVPSMFDGCQDIVKAVNKDAAYKNQNKIGAVNSINWGRVVAQVVYYFKGYLAAVETIGDEVDFSVPSGNFGNVCAAHIAKQMGLPIGQLVVATNENDVLDEFFKTGKYQPRSNDDVYQTSSPSMDISKASNLERFVFDLFDRDAEKLSSAWAAVESGKGFQLDPDTFAKLNNYYGFVSEKSNHDDRLHSIREVFEKHKIQIDTHTADGYKAALVHRREGVKMVIVETALACKFEEAVTEAIGEKPMRPKAFYGIEDLPQRSFDLENDVDAVKDFVLQHLPTGNAK